MVSDGELTGRFVRHLIGFPCEIKLAQGRQVFIFHIGTVGTIGPPPKPLYQPKLFLPRPPKMGNAFHDLAGRIHSDSHVRR